MVSCASRLPSDAEADEASTRQSIGAELRFRRESILGGGPRIGGVVVLASAILSVSACSSPAVETQTLASLSSELERIATASGAEISVYYRALGRPDSLTLRADLRMHAASTMKIPVMMQLYRDDAEGRLNVDDSLVVTRTFHSIVDGSEFELDDGSDSELELYARVGTHVSYRELNELMITVSSNLATNILIERLDAKRVTATVRSLGADSIEVLRGVEDLPAFEAGLSNTTTARDLGVILTALAEGRSASRGATQDMLDVMTRQRFNEKIPAGLPPGTTVAHKTGNITRISHDAAIVRPGEPNAYVLVVLTRGFDDATRAAAAIAEIARTVDGYSSLPRTDQEQL